MLLKDSRIFFNKELSELYPKKEIDSFFFMTAKEYLGFELADVFTQQNFILSSEKISLFNTVVDALKKEIPIQHLLNHTEFYGLRFTVNNHVLIPRPETEELVNWVLDEIKNVPKQLTILDIGTGSGCIPISIKKNSKNSTVFSMDVSSDALDVAKKNAQLNGTEIQFIVQDILATDKLLRNFDIIISNPPYVRNLEKSEIENNVLNHEPHLALFVDDDTPLIFYTKIADLAKQHLTKGGLLFFEINQYLGKETVEMLHEKGFTNVTLKKDLFGNDRMIKAFL